MSASTLNRFLKENTGRSFIDLLQSIRVRHAKELLQTSSDSITGIGYSVGFESQNSFFVTFKKVMGVTPREYRVSESRFRPFDEIG